MSVKRQRLIKYSLIIYAFLFISLSFVSCGKAPGFAKEIKVLFIGNSLTFVNDLPGLTAGLARSRNFKMEYESYAPGGYTLSQHAGDPRLLEKINKGGWDFVVLQEQSEMPAYPWAQTEVLPYAQTLSRLIRNANPRAQIAFYMTMARKNGEQRDIRNFPEIGTYEGMQRKLNDSYDQMARENQGLAVPVGPAWENVRSQNPSLNLYADDVHPNLTGTYLAACVFYSALFKDSPEGLPHPPQIDDGTAKFLQKAAGDALTPEAK
ncbi:MAG: SGNH/GDSL hydrolase family protein [Elusimicrobia bacterium]|nr:SGNH/GDSL hydrolase family protein [Elusimicrobiota bacterium]